MTYIAADGSIQAGSKPRSWHPVDVALSLFWGVLNFVYWFTSSMCEVREGVTSGGRGGTVSRRARGGRYYCRWLRREADAEARSCGGRTGRFAVVAPLRPRCE
jgi:uncharacterized protein YodC (DUF2158 family)